MMVNDPFSKRTTREDRNDPVVTPLELLGTLQTQCAESVNAGKLVACLMIKLRRTDRLNALLRDPHSARLLDEIVEVIGKALRSIDRVAVVSHDEIWIVLPDLTHVAFASLAANRLLGELNVHFGAVGGACRINPCIGAAVYPLHANSIVDLFSCAERAKIRAATVDDGFALYERSMSAGVHDPDLEKQLRDAVRLSKVEIQYQPQIDIATGECVSAEALIRLNRRDGSVASPAVLVDIAERTDIIYPLSQLVLGTALRHLGDFDRAGWKGGVSVNLSARLLSNDELPDQVDQLLRIWKIAPGRLTLEITETGVVQDMKRSVELLRRLRAMGVHLAMDDFGTGYSSLAQFRQLPLNEVKIDKLFVQNLLVSAGDRQIVHAMINLARNFGMQTVAEGVEDRATLDCLRDMRCNLAQGYLFSPALPKDEFIAWLEARERSDSPAEID
jgi:diguanylate cyclase